MPNVENIKKKILNNIVYFILCAYLSIIFGYYFVILDAGYILGGDSVRYIEGARDIINFKLPDGKGTGYLGYIIFISIFQYFKLNLTWVILIQVILTFLSSLCIYKISKKLSSHTFAIIVLSLYLFYLPLQKWNFYILTESIFICLIIFILYFSLFFKAKYIPLLFFLIFFYIIFKPHGIILIPSLALSLLTWLYLKDKLILFYLAIVFFSFLFFPFLFLLNLNLENVLLLLNLDLENENIISLVANMGIIWGYESNNNYLEFVIPDNFNNNLISYFSFLKSNISTFTIAFFKKVWFFLFRIRPFYSDLHNLYIILFYLFYWPAALFGFFKMNKKDNIGVILMYYLVILYTLAVGLSWADWDGRFSLYILPIIFIFAGTGFYNIKFLKRKMLMLEEKYLNNY